MIPDVITDRVKRAMIADAIAEARRRRNAELAMASLIRPHDDISFREACYRYIGLTIPDRAVCPHHVSPLKAVCDAYFARYPIIVWKASRGFGGKSVLLAVLSFMEAIMLGAAVSLLGGSGQQSRNVHNYMIGKDTNLPDRFWEWSGAPRMLLSTDPTNTTTRLHNNGFVRVLMASQKSVRGPHPQRLRLDEVDEMDIRILDAVLGQPMQSRDIPAQTVISSTWQNPNGTMTEVLQRARVRGWPVYEWCWKESLDFWLTADMVEQKRREVTDQMWKVEYDLQQPDAGARAIYPDSVEAMFDKSLGEYSGALGEYIEIEPPIPGASYATGTDWAKEQDWTIIDTIRTDVYPNKTVAWERSGRMPWPVMIEKYNERLKRYPGSTMHDATGLGNVVNDYTLTAEGGVVLKGVLRTEIINAYIKAIESGKIIKPFIEWAYREHYFARYDDLFGSGHLPDTICAGALAWYAGNAGGWSLGMGE